MLTLSDYLISFDCSIREALLCINKSGAGICVVVDQNRHLLGIATDGDIRRFLIDNQNIGLSIADAMNSNCLSLPASSSVNDIRNSFTKSIKIIPLVDDQNVVVDIADIVRFRRIPVLEPFLNGNELKYVTECIETNWISSQGAFVRRFEHLFEDLYPNYTALSCSSGTSALHLALLGLGIGPGDEVIVPNLTFASTASSVFHAGAHPVLCDIDPRTWCISPDSLRSVVTSRTKAIIPVHLYGQVADMKSVCAIAKEFNLYVVEDCAEALGSSLGGQSAGSFGDASIFSFFGNKTITTGEGGMVLFKNDKCADHARLLRDHGMCPDKKYWHNYIGYNYRLTNLQAAIGVAQLEQLQGFVEKKTSIMTEYLNLLSTCQHVELLPFTQTDSIHSNWLFTFLLESGINRDVLLKHLADNGIEARPVFYPLHEMPPFAACSRSSSLSNSCKLSMSGISLPSSVNLSISNIKYIANLFLQSIDVTSQMQFSSLKS
jgi:perosamine synthetase